MNINRNNETYKKLEAQLEDWLNREEDEDEDFRQEWVEEGIKLHKAILQKNPSDEEKSRYYYTLSNLYLEYGRSEKLIQGNYKTAFRYLQMAARSMPKKGDIFYHLAFLSESMTAGSEKWESAAFYAQEALDRGLQRDKEIKIWCLLGRAYLELEFLDKAEECFRHSKQLDSNDEFTRFRVKYSKKASTKDNFARLANKADRMNIRTEQEKWLEKSRSGKCFVLEADRRGISLHGNGGSVALTAYQGELIRLFFEYKNGLTKYDIINSISGDKNENSIKTDISRLRVALSRGLEVEEELIQTVGERRDQRYQWNPALETYIIER